MENSKLLQFTNCRILRNHCLEKEDLWIRNHRIINPEPIFFEEKVTADIKVDCQGCIICPGFIDIQINGGFGIDFSTNHSNNVQTNIQKVAKGILQYGVTSFCPTIITSSPETYQKIIPNISKTEGSKCGAGVLGIHLEGPFINVTKKGAHPERYIKTATIGIEEILDVYGTLKNVSMITLAPEIVEKNIITELVKKGITISLGHSAGSLVDGEEAVGAGASFITHLFNAMLPFHHRDPGLVGLLTSNKIPKGSNIYYGVIADGIHTHPSALRIAHRVNPKGFVLVTDAIAAMGLKAGIYNLGSQTIEISGKRACVKGTHTLCGSIATMDDCVRHFYKSSGCNVVEALECATLHPAQALGIADSKGTLEFGADADFLILDDNLFVCATFIGGELVWADRSKFPNALELSE